MPCARDMYKAEASPGACARCADGMSHNGTGATSPTACMCDAPYTVPVANHTTCACMPGFATALTGTCLSCPPGLYMRQGDAAAKGSLLAFTGFAYTHAAD